MDGFSTSVRKPRITVIGGFMAYFETIMEPGFRNDRRRHLAHVLDPLRAEFDITDLGLAADLADFHSMAAAIAQLETDVVLLVPTMATPPEPVARLAQMAKAPVVIASGHGIEEIGPRFDMGELCRHSSGVGATMLGAMLRRAAVPQWPILVSGFLNDATFFDELALALRTAALAKRFAGLRVGRLGVPMPGYDHVGLSPAEATASGFELVDIALGEWVATVASISDAAIATFLAERLPQLVPRGTTWTPSEDLARAARLALALDETAQRHELACGSLTCRGPFGVGLDKGAIGCLATTLMTSSGRPFSATGDIVTSIAMLMGKTLGRATLYCELDALDKGRDAFLVANTGEGDFGWCPPDGRSVILPAAAHSGRAVPGVVLSHDLIRGPATMLGATPDLTRSERLTLLALDGEIVDPPDTALKVTHGFFRTDVAPGQEAFRRWANAGATHHGALSRGRLGQAVEWLGTLTKLPVTRIGVPHA